MAFWMKPSGDSSTNLQKSLPNSEKLRQARSVSSTILETDREESSLTEQR